MLCKAGDLSRDDIGAIRVQAEAALVELRESAVAGFLSALGDTMTVEGGRRVTQLPGAPDLAHKSTPRGKPAPRPKPRHDGPAARKPAAKPTPKPAEAPKPEAPKAAKPASSPPIDWNDAPPPRHKKPKGAAKKPFKKPEPKQDKDAVAKLRKKRSADPSQSLRTTGKNRTAKARNRPPGNHQARKTAPAPPLPKPPRAATPDHSANHKRVKAAPCFGAPFTRPRR
ncbi:DbpA RNA binding domain-containing protein [Aquicoccus sp. G2-2]|uniref:DbpA RNA binding domain-containing protein n=1 Tax=Aquicoccus sp. G2-2 TaxID=3092120 RepID=UPI00366E0CF0